ncbi:hypothetical protein [Bordetella pertussis]|uniref:hypothetical protein n=1 Tax=Bordetella pertussis TaxID=520 RepID=UPI000F8E1C76|nr:hypothetical protein [Bordetella pertussis]WIQ49047.1 hypothetical protein HDL87_00115 [Bordetella pertussis]WIR21897.1 hypothetical protein HDL41_00115 [Bordetella pertussis]
MNWGGGDFQFLKSGSDEPCIQPIESSHLGQGGPAGSHHARVPVSVRMALSQGVGWPAGAARR